MSGERIDTMTDTVAMRMACPFWPDCADDEGSCLACTEAAAVIAALERGARVEAAAQALVTWQPDVAFDPAFEARFDALAEALVAEPGEAGRG